MIANAIEQMGSHLQFLGYECSRDEDRIRARHPKKFNLSMKPFAGGILFTAIIGCKDNAKRNRLGYFELINSLNQNAAIVRFYADENFDLFIEAWHPDYYERTSFGAFIETWNLDCHSLIDKPETNEYLR